jgi:aminoglycoside 6-adenylyltransferase
MPEDNIHPDCFVYLMQFMDGNRIDLTLFPLDKLNELPPDSLSVLLLDKDNLVIPFPPPDESSYLPHPPTPKEFFDCCNEFWWVTPYVAKGLWRAEICYAKHMLDEDGRAQLMQMLTWHIGINTQFQINPGKEGKYFQKYLSGELWAMLLNTYADASYANTWGALFAMCNLFRITALEVAEHFGFDYPHDDDSRVSAHFAHVRSLPKDARETY